MAVGLISIVKAFLGQRWVQRVQPLHAWSSTNAFLLSSSRIAPNRQKPFRTQAPHPVHLS